MNKKMRELLTKIQNKTEQVKSYMDGENKDVEKAESLLKECEDLQKEYDVQEKIFNLEKNKVNDDENVEKDLNKEKASGYVAISKMLKGRSLNDDEKALILTSDDTNGESNLVPEDVKVGIMELRKNFKSAKDLVTVVTTDSTSGSINYEDKAVSGLVEFADGQAIDSSDDPKFAPKSFAIKQYGKLIPISRLLLGAEKAGLLSYLNRWFIKNAIYSENKAIFTKLASGKTVKVLKGWKALKSSINKDLDPDALLDGVIITNQSGFDVLDSEMDANGRPILSVDPTNATRKMFNGLPIEVFSDAQLANVSSKAPIFYGSMKAGCTFVEHNALEFATSEHAYFNKNQNCLRVIEGFDAMQCDKDAYLYGTIEATPTTTTTGQ